MKKYIDVDELTDYLIHKAAGYRAEATRQYGNETSYNYHAAMSDSLFSVIHEITGMKMYDIVKTTFELAQEMEGLT